MIPSKVVTHTFAYFKFRHGFHVKNPFNPVTINVPLEMVSVVESQCAGSKMDPAILDDGQRWNEIKRL